MTEHDAQRRMIMELTDQITSLEEDTRRLERRRDALVLRLRAEDPKTWTIAELAALSGLSTATIMKRVQDSRRGGRR